ncbi:hypothetical protein PEC301937_15690 [Pectobacterium carotovorum subsp. carotovorum]|nr:hypothetical protein PEC301937_15690 [Pectobacterium carotovorum subsp. carotovorum]
MWFLAGWVRVMNVCYLYRILACLWLSLINPDCNPEPVSIDVFQKMVGLEKMLELPF